MSTLPEISVSERASNEYEDMLPSLISSVDKRMTARQEELDLIGSNPLSVMYDNHENHGSLMLNVLRFNDFELLKNILPWVLSNYTAKGFSPAYFEEVLDQWKKAVAQHLSAEAAQEIIPVYEWMEETVPRMIEQLKANTLVPPDGMKVLAEARSREIQDFVETLISGDYQKAHRYIQQRATDQQSLQQVYDSLIRPAMYEVGRLWEQGRISVAYEHLATSVIMRIITYFYVDVVSSEQTKGKALVTASANEYHEIGARIVADFLEMDGWNVSYLGANTPAEDLISMIEDEGHDILCISVTMPFNLVHARKLISRIREKEQLQHTCIMVGGLAFTYSSTAAEKLGADAAAASAAECVRLADSWWTEHSHG